MSIHAEFFFLLAELSLVLAGFAGVTAAFAGRERAFRPTEKQRLQGLFNQAVFVLVGSLTLYTAHMAELGETLSIRLGGAVGLLFTLVLQGRALISTYRVTLQPDSSSEPWAVYVATALVGIQGALSAAAIIWPQAWLLAAAFSIALVFGIWLFYRLLTRAN